MLLPLTHTHLVDQIIQNKAGDHRGCVFRSVLTRVSTFHTFLSVGLMLPCKFISSAKQNRTPFFPPFLLKTKSFSGIWQLVDS